MSEALASLLQTPLVAACVAVRTKEIRPHVVVNTMDLPTQGVKMHHHFRSDQTAGAGDEEPFLFQVGLFR